jgi:hypothetical protein
VYCFVLLIAGSAFAKTADGKTPAVETVCDNEHGAAFGICNAYCEAIDCTDPNQRANNQACENLKANFEKHTGRQMPCDVSCPCADMLRLFANIDSGAVRVAECIAYPTVLYVATSGGDYALVDDGPPATCSANGEAPFVPLTPAERLACRVRLRQAVEARGGTCRLPE